MPKRSLEEVTGPSCPCCAERISFVGSRPFRPAKAAVDLCSTCVDIDGWDAPPFVWPTSADEIRASTKKVLEAAAANLDAAAAAEPPTFASVIAPLMMPPNYKTNPLVCQCE